ncbi:MAG: iron-containing alcohol dehydrogenase, partial [Thermoleophilia bacterium]|nr:iron-containing alcohol dehydrogenase [Thermoleophilia bacterium]
MSTERISVLHMPSIALGPGASLEAGHHLQALGVTRVFLVTDEFLQHSGLIAPIEAAVRADGLDVVVYAVPTGEPTEDSMREAAEACVASGADGVLGV